MQEALDPEAAYPPKRSDCSTGNEIAAYLWGKPVYRYILLS